MPVAFIALAGVNLAQMGLGLTDPAWATTLNTILLIILAVLSQRGNRKVDDTREKVVEARKDIGDVKDEARTAASTAESAATAAADTARIAKDIGAAIRHTQLAPDGKSTDPTVRVSDLPEIRRDLDEDIGNQRGRDLDGEG